MTPEERQETENRIRDTFSELQEKLKKLKDNVKLETDNIKSLEKTQEIEKLETEISEIKKIIDTLQDLQDKDLQNLKERIKSIKKLWEEFGGEISNLAQEIKDNDERKEIESTYKLLSWSETYVKLLKIISSNPKDFKNLEWITPEDKLEKIFSKINRSVKLFLESKLWKSGKVVDVIDKTVAPALEWSMMEMLWKQKNKDNIKMLENMNNISLDNLKNFFDWIGSFATNTKESFNKFNQWVNAIDYLSVHNGVLSNPEKSLILTDPFQFKNYLNNPIFDPKDENGKSINFSPYLKIDTNIFQVDDNQSYKFWISLDEQEAILNQIWNIQVANNPETIKQISKILNKSDSFVSLQTTANSLLDWVNSINSITKVFWVDIIKEIEKAPKENSSLYRIINFICKLVWITWWLDKIISDRRRYRLNLTWEKNNNISNIIKNYKKLEQEWKNVSIVDSDSCSLALSDFDLTDLREEPTTFWDKLRNTISENMDINIISPSIVKQFLWDSYIIKKKSENCKQEEVINSWMITADIKKELVHHHIENMKKYLKENYNKLKDFYENIHNTDDIALFITASLYANRDDIVEWIKAKVFLPENYGIVYESIWSNDWSWLWNNWETTTWWRDNLDSTESSDKQVVSEQWMYDEIAKYSTDKRQNAYILATVKKESSGSTGFKNQGEIKTKGNEWKPYRNIDNATWKAYYGRWFIQLTRKNNYEKFTKIINESWKDFIDNNGNSIKWSEINLVRNPDIILRSNDLAVFILVYWMKNWIFTWKKLDDYINEKDKKKDFVWARQIVNGQESAELVANYAETYLNTLNNSTTTSVA